jgi:hypothetical protein
VGPSFGNAASRNVEAANRAPRARRTARRTRAEHERATVARACFAASSPPYIGSMTNVCGDPATLRRHEQLGRPRRAADMRARRSATRSAQLCVALSTH